MPLLLTQTPVLGESVTTLNFCQPHFSCITFNSPRPHHRSLVLQVGIPLFWALSGLCACTRRSQLGISDPVVLGV